MPFHFDYEETFPNTDFNQINLDWILQLATQLKETAESGGFDGAPGEPGTATNGIAYFTTADTFADIQAAITNGELPVLNYYIMGSPAYFYCYDHSNVWVDFIGFYGLVEYQLRWSSNGNKSLSSWSLASLQSPAFTGNPTVPTQEPTNSSMRIANTAFVQNAVSVAVQAAIEQLVIAPFSESFKQALLQLARKVAYIDGQGQTYYDALYNALYPPINVDHITAVWNPPQDYVVYTTTPIDSLKTYLTVTATYDDQTTGVLDDNDYVLSGNLTAGTSVITVTFASATTTFNVTVVANVVESISATFNQGSAVIYDTDSLSTLVPYLTVTATYTNLNTVYVDYPDYTLSGTLAEGTSNITVSYSGKTDTFSVTVTEMTWDIDWNYTNGLPQNNGFTVTNNSNLFSASLVSDGVALSCANYTSTAKYIWYAPNPEPTFTSGGIAEFVVTVNSICGGNGFFATLSNGTNGARVRILSSDGGTTNASHPAATNIGLYYDGASSAGAYNTAGMTKIADLTSGSRYTVRVERTADSHARVWLDGVLIHEASTLSTYYATNSRFGMQCNGNATLEAMRMKIY